MGASWADHKSKKKNPIILKYHLLLFYTTKTNHFLTGLWHVMNSEFQDNQQWSAQWLDWEVLQNTSQSRTCPKKGQGNCLVVCRLSDSLQLSESWINHYFWVVCSALRCTTNCKACSWHWSTEHSQFFTTLDCTSYNQKVNEFLPYMKFCFICHIHLTSSQPTTNAPSISTTFCSENASTTSRTRKCFPRGRWLPKHRFLHYRNLKKTTYFSLAKMCWS